MNRSWIRVEPKLNRNWTGIKPELNQNWTNSIRAFLRAHLGDLKTKRPENSICLALIAWEEFIFDFWTPLSKRSSMNLGWCWAREIKLLSFQGAVTTEILAPNFPVVRFKIWAFSAETCYTNRKIHCIRMTKNYGATQLFDLRILDLLWKKSVLRFHGVKDGMSKCKLFSSRFWAAP